jgi:beta-lactamase class A
VVLTRSGRFPRGRHAGSGGAGRHRGGEPAREFSAGFAGLARLALAGAQVSARATDLATGRVLFTVDDHVVLPTASIGKVLLLIELSARMTERDSAGLALLDRRTVAPVGDSGLWQHLQAPSLPAMDLAALVGGVSDNLATNVLLRHVGQDAVRARSESLGLSKTALLDIVRNERGPDDAPHLSVGSARELTWLFAALARGEVVDAATSARVVGWLTLNTDQSMVASAFGIDPLAHRVDEHGLVLINKTGTDRGVRAEAGVLRGPRAGAAYAVLLHFPDRNLSTRLSVLDAMRTIGLDLLEYVH